MPRRKKPEKPLRRRRGTGSISVDPATGTVRARLPAAVDPKRTAREFPRGCEDEAIAWLDSFVFPQILSAPAPATVTLGYWVGSWWDTYVAPILAPNTSRHYLYLLQQLAPLYEALLAEVRPSMLQGIVGALSGRIGAATVHQAVGVWRACLEAAVDDERLARNPARRLTLPKTPPRTARRHVSPAEAALLRAAIVGHRFEAAYALLLGCGLRIGEVLGLSWSHVDLAGRRAWIQRQWTGSAWRELPKSRVPRWVDLPPMVISALIRHRNSQPEGSTLVMQSPYPRKRTGETQPWSAFIVTDDLHKLVAELKLDDLTPHAARHGLASALLEGGASAAAVAERLGHSNPGVTLKTYIHASAEGREEVGKLIDQYLSDTSEQEQQSG